MASDGNDTVISCYEIDEEPFEKGSFSLPNEGKNIIMKSDSNNLYVVHGNLIGKLIVPSMDVEYLEETPHTDSIMDFHISGNFIFTT
jgi:hypothetical protein